MPVEQTPEEARQGRASGRGKRILIGSLIGVVVVGLIMYFLAN